MRQGSPAMLALACHTVQNHFEILVDTLLGFWLGS